VQVEQDQIFDYDHHQPQVSATEAGKANCQPRNWTDWAADHPWIISSDRQHHSDAVVRCIRI